MNCSFRSPCNYASKYHKRVSFVFCPNRPERNRTRTRERSALKAAATTSGGDDWNFCPPEKILQKEKRKKKTFRSEHLVGVFQQAVFVYSSRNHRPIAQTRVRVSPNPTPGLIEPESGVHRTRVRGSPNPSPGLCRSHQSLGVDRFRFVSDYGSNIIRRR